MTKRHLLTAAALLLTAAGPAHAGVIYNLAAGWSDSANPAGAWSYRQGTTALAHFATPGDGNGLNAAAANGFWGAGPDFSTSPFLLKTTASGAATPSYGSADFAAGDVIVHSTNPGAGAAAFIDWTAPAAGTISFASSHWYATRPSAAPATSPSCSRERRSAPSRSRTGWAAGRRCR